jgi:PAS domain S-box-containing protein
LGREILARVIMCKERLFFAIYKPRFWRTLGTVMNIAHYISNGVDAQGLGAIRQGADFSMACVVQGSLELRTSGSSAAVEAGGVLFGRASELILPLPDGSAEACEYCIVLFGAEGEDAEVVEGLVAAGVQKLKPGLGFTREQLERRLRSGSTAMRRSAEHYLLSFIYDFSDSGAVKSSSAVMDRHLGNAIAYMKGHLQEAVTLESLASAINISKTHLIRIFRKELGTSPMRYLTGLRVEESASLLSGTDMTLGQVAERLNFYSDSHFSKVFKKSMGENPSAYRHTYIDSLLSRQAKSFEELEKSYLFIQQLIDATDDLFFYKNVEGRYLGCNAAFCRFAGLARDGIVGKTDFEIFQPEMAKGFAQNDRKVLEERKTHSNEEWISYKDGSRVLVEVSKSPFFGLRREVGGVIGISRDITYRRMAEERLLVAKEEAEKGRRDTTEEALSAFRALSRTLASSSAYLELLRMSESDPEKSLIIDRAIRGAETMEGLLDAFTGIRETEIGEYALDDSLFSLKEIMAAAAEFARARYPRLDTSFEASDEVPMLLRGGKGALLKIATSLIAHIGGAGARKATFLFGYGEGGLSIRAADDGPRLLGNRTSPFRAEEAGEPSGSRSWDVSLWFCQDIVEYMGGEWNITNGEGGVAFSMAVPIRRGAV